MTKKRAIILGISQSLIILLIVLSIIGAFLGAERASVFFNSPAMIVYWLVILVILISGLIFFPSLRKNAGLAMLHIGCILVILGGIWGSQKCNIIQKRFFNIDKAYSGVMLIYEGYSDNWIHIDSKKVKELPFSIKLKDFKIVYYSQDTLYIDGGTEYMRSYPMIDGAQTVLDDGTKVKVLKKFDNFKISINEGSREAIDSPGAGLNYAASLEITNPDGTTETRYAFKPGLMMGGPMSTGQMSYYRTIKDYISDVEVIENGKVVKTCSIEVNKPLHYGGYHFYQSSYDDESGKYTVLSVHSDSGSTVSYAGFTLLGVGVFWLLWFKKMLPLRKKTDGN